MKRWLRAMFGPAAVDESSILHAALGSRRGVMLDVGAHYGYSLAPFARDGWTVHAFEPDPANRLKLQEHVGDQPNVRINPVAVSDCAGTMTLFTSEVSTGISSLAPFTASHEPSVAVGVVTLGDYMTTAGITAVDFMKIDVEGFERNVLRGYDWKIRPEMILLEFEDSKTVPLGYSWKDLAGDLVARGYEVLVSEWFPVERYGAAHRWRRLAQYPTELADPNGWGNLLAVPSAENVIGVARPVLRRYRARREIERLVRRRISAPGRS